MSGQIETKLRMFIITTSQRVVVAMAKLGTRTTRIRAAVGPTSSSLPHRA